MTEAPAPTVIYSITAFAIGGSKKKLDCNPELAGEEELSSGLRFLKEREESTANKS